MGWLPLGDDDEDHHQGLSAGEIGWRPPPIVWGR